MIQLVAEQLGRPPQLPDQLFSIWINKQLVRVETMTRVGLIRSVDSIAIDGPRPCRRKVTVPDLVGVFRQLNALEFNSAFVIKQTQLHLGCMSGEQRKVDSEAIPGRTQRKGLPLGHA